MKRLLIAVVLALVVAAIAASPAVAKVDAQAGGPVVTAPHAAVIAHQGTVGAAAAPSTAHAMMIGRGVHIRMVPVGHGGNGIAIALLVALVIAGAVYAIVADRRQAPAKSAEPARLPAFKPAANQKRKAA